MNEPSRPPPTANSVNRCDFTELVRNATALPTRQDRMINSTNLDRPAFSGGIDSLAAGRVQT